MIRSRNFLSSLGCPRAHVRHGEQREKQKRFTRRNVEFCCRCAFAALAMRSVRLLEGTGKMGRGGTSDPRGPQSMHARTRSPPPSWTGSCSAGPPASSSTTPVRPACAKQDTLVKTGGEEKKFDAYACPSLAFNRCPAARAARLRPCESARTIVQFDASAVVPVAGRSWPFLVPHTYDIRTVVGVPAGLHPTQRLRLAMLALAELVVLQNSKI